MEVVTKWSHMGVLNQLVVLLLSVMLKWTIGMIVAFLRALYTGE